MFEWRNCGRRTEKKKKGPRGQLLLWRRDRTQRWSMEHESVSAELAEPG